MTLLHWRPSMSLGVPVIDADHRALIEILNRLHFMIRAGDEQREVAAVLRELIDYVRCHFAREEALMRQCGYPGLDRHVARHRDLAAALSAWDDHYRADPDRFDAVGFYDFVADWLVVHVLEDDMKLRPYLAEDRKVANA